MKTDVPVSSARQKRCVCCEKTVESTTCRVPICDACVAPGEARSYCAKCGARGSYPFEDFMRVMAVYYPVMQLGPGTAIRLPACAACLTDPPSKNAGVVRFYGISFD